MIERSVYQDLLAWKRRESKTALCVIGARQIGKTTIIKAFGEANYKSFVYINFVTEPEVHKIFEGNLDADTIIRNLTAYKMQEMVVGDTLIFLDEIQECPNARCAIKFLVEDGRYDYIESGSLLGTKYHNIPSYPVGFEELYYMYPLSFLEFAAANGLQDSTFALLRDCYDKHEPVPEIVHETMLRLFYTYIVVGGMPAAVQTYVDTHDIGKVAQIQRDILELYRLDIAKYSQGNDRIKIKAIWDSIPAQLDQPNRRFFLSKVDENGRQNRYENSFLWLSDAGVALPVYNVTEPQAPLQLNERRSLFKLYMNDTGLLCAACMKNVQFAILQGDLEINMGSILENAFAQALKCNGFSLNYYESKKIGEIDFVIQNGTDVDLIEIKSGKSYDKHPSLTRLVKEDAWRFDKAMVFCSGNVACDADTEILYLPWYMVMFYQPERMPINMIHEVDLSML